MFHSIINPIISHEIHRSSEDLSPNFVDRNVSIYDRSTRLSESSASDMYIRRPNNYHHNESRGRPRDRHYRNGSYSSTVDRCVYHFYPPLSHNGLWFCFEIQYSICLQLKTIMTKTLLFRTFLLPNRSNSSILHRSTSNTWYENSNVSNTSRNVYGNLPSAAVVVTPDSAYDTTTDRRTSETECSSKSISKNRGKTTVLVFSSPKCSVRIQFVRICAKI